MSTPENAVLQLIEEMAQPSLHSPICKCTMCMKSKIPLSQRDRHEEGLKSTMVDRRNPDDPVRPLMKATEAHAIIQAGTKIDMLQATGINPRALSMRTDSVPLMEPREITIRATWKNRHQEAAISGRDASVFGGLGVLLVPANFSVIDIPKMNALAAPERFLDKYGAKLVPLETPVELEAVDDPELENLYLVQYDWDPDYIEQYVMHKQGGGGLFVETHPFPHVFTPLSPDCGGALILGVANKDNTFSFTSLTIPFGYTMQVDSNVIHGDSFFTGPYAIALTETELADSVLFRQETSSRDIQRVSQTPVQGVQLPLLAEYRLAKAINHDLLINVVLHYKADESLEFFLKLPPDVLSKVQQVSEVAQDAYQQRRSWIESIEEIDEPKVDDLENIRYHTFFKMPKSHPARTDKAQEDLPTNKGPGK